MEFIAEIWYIIYIHYQHHHTNTSDADEQDGDLMELTKNIHTDVEYRNEFHLKLPGR